jgi:hypothetical protein
MPRMHHTSLATCVALAFTGVSAQSAAAGKCDESGTAVAVTSALGVGVGAAAALISSGVIVASDDTRDYDFGLGAGVGIGVTAGLTGLYTLVDASTGCMMAYDSGGYVVWSVPIVTFIIGALLPIAIWGAADDGEGEAGTGQQALRGPLFEPAISSPLPKLTFSF